MTYLLNGRWRRLVWAAVAVLLILSVVGCEPPPLDLVETQEIVVLWHGFSGEEARALEALADRFNDENPWDIVLITEYQTDIPGKLQGLQESRPDLVTTWARNLPVYVATGSVEPLPLTAPELRPTWNDLLPMAQALYEMDGMEYGAPLGLATYVLYYNADWLADLGYDVETAGWEDLRRTTCAASDPARGRVGLAVPARASTFLAFLAASGSQVMTPEGMFGFSDEPGQGAAALLKTILSGRCGAVYEDWRTGLEHLGRGATAMVVESSQHRAEVEAAVQAGRNFRLSLAPLPGPKGPGPSLWYGPGLMLVAPATGVPDPEHQRASRRVLAWFLSKEAQRYWGDVTTFVPVRKSVVSEVLTEAEQVPVANLDIQLWRLTLDAVTRETWAVWPAAADDITCRASLLRGLLAMQEEDADPRAYVETAVTACNIGAARSSSDP